MDLNQARKIAPELNGLDDDTAINVIHRTYYPDLSREEVASSMGYKPPEVKQSAGLLRTAADMGIKGAQGVVGLGQSAVGLASLATGGLVGKGMRAIGYDPEATQAMIGEGLSDAQKASDAKVQQAQGFSDTVMASLENPRAIAGAVAESLPSMLASGSIAGAAAKSIAAKAAAPLGGLGTEAGKAAAAKAIEAAGPKLAWMASGAEGGLTAGQIADQGQAAGSDFTTYAPAAVAGGAGTAVIGRAAGKLMGDAETSLFTGAKGIGIQGSMAARIAKGVAGEGVLEEMPQSAQEQAFTNVATGKPVGEGVAQAAASGLVTGGAMGGAMGALQKRNHAAAIEEVKAKYAPDQAIADNLRESGETEAADILNKTLNRRVAKESAGIELGAMAEAAPDLGFHKDPEFATHYEAMRIEGGTPAIAAARAAMWSSYKQIATDAGMSQKAVDAALAAAKDKKLEDVPAYLEKFTKIAQAKGLANDRAMDVLPAIQSVRDDAIQAVTKGLYGKAESEEATNAALDKMHRTAEKELQSLRDFSPEPFNPNVKNTAPATTGQAPDQAATDQGLASAGTPAVAEAVPAAPGNAPVEAAGVTVNENGIVTSQNGNRVRVMRHERGSNMLDPEADVGAFVYDIKNGAPLTLILNKNGKLVTKDKVLAKGTDKSNGEAWVPSNDEVAEKVKKLLHARVGTRVGEDARTRIDAEIEALVRDDVSAEVVPAAPGNAPVEAAGLKKPGPGGSLMPVKADLKTAKGLEVTLQREFSGKYNATIGGEPAGSVVYTDTPSGGFRVTGIDVDPKFRRKGVASAIYDFLEKDVTGQPLAESGGQSEDGIAFRRARASKVEAAGVEEWRKSDDQNYKDFEESKAIANQAMLNLREANKKMKGLVYGSIEYAKAKLDSNKAFAEIARANVLGYPFTNGDEYKKRVENYNDSVKAVFDLEAQIATAQKSWLKTGKSLAESGGQSEDGIAFRRARASKVEAAGVGGDAAQIAEAVSKANRLGLKGAERTQWVVDSLAGMWGMTPDEVRDVPAVAAALRKNPSKEDATAATVRAVEQVVRQAEQAVAAEGAGAVEAAGVKTLSKMLTLKSTTLMRDDGNGRRLYDVAVSPEFRNKHFVNGRMPVVDGLELKPKSDVTGNVYDRGWVLIDNREQLANRRGNDDATGATVADGQQDAPVRTGEPEPSPALSIEPRADGTLAVSGPVAEIKAKLKAAGIPDKSVMSGKGKVIVGKTQAKKAKAALQQDDTAENAIRKSVDDSPHKTIGSWHPISVTHNGVTQQFLFNIKRIISDGKGPQVIHLKQIKEGRIISSDDKRPLVHFYKLDRSNSFDEEGIPRYADDRDLKQWSDAFNAGLTAPTPAEVIAQQERKDNAEALDDKEQEEKDRAERIQKEIDARQRASAENFILGQNAEDALAGQGDVFNQPAQQSDATLYRSRRNSITFSTPYIGKTGAKLVGYEWANKKIEYVDKRGEDRVKRISDWEAADVNEVTGRDIVHKFAIVNSDGSESLMSAETAAVALGISETAVRSNAKNLLESEIAKQKKEATAEKNLADAVNGEWFATPAKAVEGLPDSLRKIWMRRADWGKADSDYPGREKLAPFLKGPKGWQAVATDELPPKAMADKGFSHVTLMAKEVWDKNGNDATSATEPAAETQSDEDWMQTLFGGSAQTTPAESASNLDAPALRKLIQSLVTDLQAQRADWESREYKGNSNRVNLRGDGPSNQESLSITNINEGRRTKVLQSIDSQLKQLDKLDTQIETAAGANEFMQLVQSTWDKAQAFKPQSPDQLSGGALFESLMIDALKLQPAQGSYTSLPITKALREMMESGQAAPAAQATAILDAAEVKGKERIDVLKDVKSGTITPEEVQAAYPAKEDKFPSTAQGAIDAFNADDSAQAVAIMAKLKLDDLKEVGGAIGFRPQNGENAKSFRERIGTVADKLTLTNRKQTSNEMKLHTRLTQLASDYDRAIAHRDRAIANGAEAGSSAFEGQYEGQWTTIDKGLEILENALREESKSPDYAKVSAMVKEARPAIFDAAKPDNSVKPEAKEGPEELQAAYPAKEAAKIEDFGEKLEGARKDAAPSLKNDLADEVDEVMAEIQPKAAAPVPAPQPDTPKLSAEDLANHDKALLAGSISVQDYMDATGLTDEDVGSVLGDGLRQQADREAKAADPYHQGIQKMQEALADQMRAARAAQTSTPQQRKSKDERIGRIGSDSATLDMIARGFEHPFDNRYVTKLSPMLKARFNKQWESIKTGEFAKRDFQEASYKLWAQKVIDKAHEKLGAPEPAQQASAAAQPDAPKLTPAEAKSLMAWEDLGQKDGVKTHALTFYESQADKDAKRGRMIVAKVSKGDRSATAWMVDGEDKTFGMLAQAKKLAEEVGMAKAVADGFVEEVNPFAEYDAVAKQYGYEVRPDGMIGSDGKFPGPKMAVQRGRLRVESGAGNLLGSYAATPESIGKFLEAFWYAEKKAVRGSAPAQQEAKNPARADAGVAMFARGDGLDAFRASLSKLSAPSATDPNVTAQVQAWTDELSAKWQNAPTIRVVASSADLPVPATSDTRGMYYRGTVYVVAGRVGSKRAVGEVLAHESVAHYGLREMLGKDDWQRFMGNIQLAIKSGNKPLNAIRDEIRSVYVDENGKPNLTPDEEADEIAARVVEKAIDANGEFKPGFAFVKSVYAKIAQFLRDMGLNVQMTHLELQGALVNAQRNLEAGNRTAGGGQTVVAASREDAQAARNDQTQTPEFKRWFGDSKVVDAEGKPLVVYHGTGEDFSVFAGNKLTHYFTPNLDYSYVKNAYKLGKPVREGDTVSLSGGNVMPVFLSLQNPLRTTDTWLIESLRNNPEKVAEIKAQGHDGVIYSKKDDVTKGPSGWGDDRPQIVAFDPTQIKSAIGNNGNFDPTNPDIRYARGTNAPVTNQNDVVGNQGGRSADDKTPGVSEFQKRLIAAQDMADEVKSTGQRLIIRSDGTVSLFHSTSESNANAIRAGGTFKGNTWFSASKAATIEHAKPKHGKFTTTIEVAVDPRNIEFSTGTGEFYAPDGLTRNDAGVWVKPNEPTAPDSFGAPMAARGDAAVDPRDPATFAKKSLTAVNDLIATHKTFNWWNSTVGTQYQKAQQDKDFKRAFDATQDYILDVSRIANDAADRARDLLPKLEHLSDTLKHTKRSDVDAIAKPIFQGTLADKRVYKAEELKRVFGLSDKQVDLYKQFRQATDKSLDDLTTSTIAKMVRNAGIPEFMFQAELETGDHQAIAQAAQEWAKKEPKQQALAEQVMEASNRAKELKAEGYAPLMRFGQYSVSLRDAKTNELQEFYLFESERKANAKAREIAGKGKVEQSVMSKDDYMLLKGVSPESIELFGDILEKAGMLDAKDEMFQEFLRKAIDQRSAMKRMIHREGYPGYAQDVRRVLSTFITSNARLASKNLHFSTMLEAVENIPKSKGDVRDEATRMVHYVQNPVEEASKIRGLLFVNFIGGSVASAITNMTQTLTMTLPYLSQFSSPAKATATIAKAVKMAAGDIKDQVLAADLARAEQSGVVSPQEIHNLNAEAMATFGANPLVQRGLFIWGSLFSMAEQFNRRAAFIAAYEMARENGEKDAYEFAKKAVVETQGIYNKGNRPNWSRGAVGATLFTFKQFSISYLEFLSRLPKREKALALAILMLAAGAEGLPFSDDIDDVIDTIAQRMGYSFNSKIKKRQFIGEVLGDGAADFILKGVSSIPGMPIDIAARMGMANLLPGTGMLRKDVKDHMRDVMEFAGPAGGVVQNATQGKFLPTAISNAVKGVDMFSTGMYRDDKGRKVLDVDAADALYKAIGFQPATVGKESLRARMVMQDIALNKAVEADIAGDMAQAKFEQDKEMGLSAMEKLDDWNRKNPESRIGISPRQINQRVKEMAKTKDSRIIHGAPKELRLGLRDYLN